MRKIYLKMTKWFIFLVVFTFVGINSTYATVNLGNLTIKPQESYSSTKAFKVRNSGELKITTRMRINTATGFGDSVDYKISLMKDSTVLKSVNITANATYKSVTLKYNLSDCSKTGWFKIRINRIGGGMRTGKATFLPFNPPDFKKATHNLPQFNVKKGSSITRNLSTYIEPNKVGKLVIHATWKSACDFKQAGCKLLFRLKRNGQIVASSNGYTAKPLVGKKMEINYQVQSNQVGDNWKLEVVGNPKGNAIDVKPKITFTFRCGS